MYLFGKYFSIPRDILYIFFVLKIFYKLLLFFKYFLLTSDKVEIINNDEILEIILKY